MDSDEYRESIEKSEVKDHPTVREYCERRDYFKKVRHCTDALKDPKFIEPKPQANQ